MKRTVKEDKSSTYSIRNHAGESNIADLVSHVFGQNSLKTILNTGSVKEELIASTILQNTNVWISDVLDGLDPTMSVTTDIRPGRLGISQVRFDSTAQSGALKMSADRLHAQAVSSFSTVRANVCCFSGKWQYELHLESKGVMQVGWTMNQGVYGSEIGIGDTIYSYAYDGNRMRKWNQGTAAYGEAWQAGDIVGCTIDLDIGSIHFYRNGRDLGEAFSKIPLGPDCVYYAAISLAFEEQLEANFGATPFKYPIKPFLPLQQSLTGAVCRARQLLDWLTRICERKDQPSGFGNSKPSPRASTLLLCQLLVKHLSEYLVQQYVIVDCLVPFLHGSISITAINLFLDSISLFLEPEEFKEIIDSICKCLVTQSNITSPSFDYEDQKYSLTVLSNICQNLQVRRTLLKQPDFLQSRMGCLVDVRPIDLLTLKNHVSSNWWHSGNQQEEEFERRKSIYLRDCKTINNKILELEYIQECSLMLLLNNDDGTYTDASTRKCFLHMLRGLLKDNHISGLVSAVLNNQATATLLPLPIALSLFHRLVSVLRQLWLRECDAQLVYVPLSAFYTGTIDYVNIERMGGLFGHLLNTFRSTIEEQLGADHEVLTAQPQVTSTTNRPVTVQAQVREIDRTAGTMSLTIRSFILETEERTEKPVTAQPVSSVASLTELLDDVVLLYNLTVHSQLTKISSLRDEFEKYIKLLEDARVKYKTAKDSEIAAQIKLAIQTFERKVEEQAQTTMVWITATVFTPEKRDNLLWLWEAVLTSLEKGSEQGNLFGFVPEFYVDTLVDISSILRTGFHPTLPFSDDPDHRKLMQRTAEFLVNHLSDDRIVNPHVKDMITEAIAGLVVKKATLECLENMSLSSQDSLVRTLLGSYENRAWGQSNWILMRMWKGNGFAFRYQTPPRLNNRFIPRTQNFESAILMNRNFEPCPSDHYQQLIARLLTQHPSLATEFLNTVLKQLNWMFSEFISMLQEIQKLSKRTERVIIDARQLKKCGTCFEFVVSMLRVVEMVCCVSPRVWTEGSENMLERLCQVLNQILLRVTSWGGSFSQVISLEVPDLDSVDHFPLLVAVAGVLVALLAEDLSKEDAQKSSDMSSAARCLLAEPSFDIDNIKFLLGESESKSHQKHGSENEKTFSLENYPDSVSMEEIRTLRQMISVLSQYKADMPTVTDVDEEDLCPICSARPLEVMFIPCHHQSCKSCITHYLMDSKECFFCKVKITAVTFINGMVLYDSKSSLLQTSATSDHT